MDYTFPPEHVYTLSDPRDKSVRYIGRTVDVEHRYYQHIATTRGDNPEKEAWILELRNLDLKPIMTVIETVNHEDRPPARKRERHWILFYQARGADLFNKRSTRKTVPPIVYGAITLALPLEEENAQLRAENERLRAIIKQISQIIDSQI